MRIPQVIDYAITVEKRGTDKPLTSGCLIEQGSNSAVAVSDNWFAVSAAQLHLILWFSCPSKIKENSNPSLGFWETGKKETRKEFWVFCFILLQFPEKWKAFPQTKTNNSIMLRFGFVLWAFLSNQTTIIGYCLSARSFISAAFSWSNVWHQITSVSQPGSQLREQDCRKWRRPRENHTFRSWSM